MAPATAITSATFVSSARLGVDRRTIQRYELGQIYPVSEILAALVLEREIAERIGRERATAEKLGAELAATPIASWPTLAAIAATNSGRLGLALHMASAALPHGSGWLTKISGSSAFSALNVLQAGTCSRGGGGFRSGDFSGAQADPDGTSLWLAGENFGSVSASCNWQTGIVKVVP
jgi:hypothetical protein